jgi:Fe-S-cluster containining protein
MVVGLDCPYLTTEKTCAIYPVRPYLCRIMGVTEERMMQCPDCHPDKVLNKAVSSYLYKQIYLAGKEKARTEKHKKILLPILESLNL